MSKMAKWANEIDRLLSIRSQFVISGNINDLQIYQEKDSDPQPGNLEEVLWRTLKKKGYECIVKYNPVKGISFITDRSFNEEIDFKLGESLDVADGITLKVGDKPSFETLANYIEQLVKQRSDGKGKYVRHNIAIFMDYASRITKEVDGLSDEEYTFFRACDYLSKDAVQNEETERFNPLIWCVQNRYDLPIWYGAGTNRVVFQEIESPSHEQRKTVAQVLIQHIDTGFQGNREKYVEMFADLSEGLRLQDLQDITVLCRGQQTSLEDLDDAIRGYKTGNQDINSPWREEGLKQRIRDARDEISEKLKGQDAALELTLDILKRSIMGLTGAQTKSSSSRPRGVLFLAGPTGVGKTLLAKSLTKSIFGTEDAYIRFDMSEFSAEHSAARLLGAPPGYVGFESGGELTKAVRAKPFSVILFDEIEKAHPRILDKFLQILEDGRITDGQGDTVFFSESIIVFTSNLGIVKRGENGQAKTLVTPGTPYDKMKEIVEDGINHHFTYELGRPEILNRMGENIVVFDFIRSDVARDIFNGMMNSIESRVTDEHNSTLTFSHDTRDTLLRICTSDLKNGGRGIGNMLETSLINPLARGLFELDNIDGKEIFVQTISYQNNVYNLTLEVR